MIRSVLILLFVAVIHPFGWAQNEDQKTIDSLLSVLNNAAEDTMKVNNLITVSNLHCNLMNYEDAAKYAEEAVGVAVKLGFQPGIARAYHLNARIKFNQAKYFEALDIFQKAIATYQQLGNEKGIIRALQAIGLVYLNLSDYPKALEYDLKALKMMEASGDKKGTAGPLHNIGLVYDGMLNAPEALKYFLMAKEINIEFDNKPWLCRNYEAIGNYYNGAGDYAEALKNYQEAIRIAKEANDYYAIESASANMAVAYMSKGDYDIALEKFQELLETAEKRNDDYSLAHAHINVANIRKNQGKPVLALNHLKKGLSAALRSGEKEGIKLSYLRLAEVDSILGDFRSAYEDQKNYKLYNDSIFNLEKDKKIAQQQMQYDFDKKEAESLAEQAKKDAIALEELQKQKIMRNAFIGGFAIVALFAGVFFLQRNRIKKAKNRSEELLLNILPEEVAEELKAKGSADAQLIDQVTVLFTDFKGFTAMSEKLSPKELVADLHECFSAFDMITEKYGLEKIKTIGDSYMAAGGLPTPNKTHARDAIQAAMEMRDFIEAGKQKKMDAGTGYFQIRIGIHTGPVVAGIVGVKKFQYDIWGDTVNTASRMESSGEVGHINISETTFELVKNEFNCVARGKVVAKGKGEMEMYFVG